MSVVVAIKQNGKVYMGCDSQVTSGGTRTTLKNPNNYKIWTVQGDAPNTLMASVGDLRDACVVRCINDFVDEYDIYKDRIGFRFVVRHIVPRIIEELKSVGYVKPSDEFNFMNSSFLFCYKDQLFCISNDASVIEIDDYCAIGSGKKEAVGSLLSTEDLPPEQRIVQAIKASAANDL